MIENTVSRIINQIQNSVIIKNYGVEIPRNRITKNLAKILFTEGFIEDVMETIFTSKKNIPFLFIRLKYHPIQRISIITKLQLISHSRLRVYIKQKELSQVLGKLNLLFLSTLC